MKSLLIGLLAASLWTVPASFTNGSRAYVIDASHPDATDDSNPTGTIRRPRRSLPDVLSAGSVVDLCGPYLTPQTSPHRLQLQGTEAQPILVRSCPWKPAEIRADWEVTGDFWTLSSVKFIAAGLVIVAPSSRVQLEDLEIAGDGATCHGIALVSYDTADRNTQIQFHSVFVHQQGDLNAAYDQDCHGLQISARADHVWVTGSTFAYNSGDGVQINAGVNGQASTHHLWFEGNEAHHNKQTGFWVKQASLVFFVRNTCHDHRTTSLGGGNYSLGACLGQQYGPGDVWWLENQVRDADRGILIASDLTPTDPARVFVLDNTFTNIKSATPGQASDPWQPCGVNLEGAKQRYVMGNTVTASDCGYASNTNAGQQTISYQNRVVNVARPTVGSFFTVTATTRDKVLAVFQEQVQP